MRFLFYFFVKREHSHRIGVEFLSFGLNAHIISNSGVSYAIRVHAHQIFDFDHKHRKHSRPCIQLDIYTFFFRIHSAEINKINYLVYKLGAAYICYPHQCVCVCEHRHTRLPYTRTSVLNKLCVINVHTIYTGYKCHLQYPYISSFAPLYCC